MAPDEQAFEDDLQSVAYLVGEADARWGRVTTPTIAWPYALFWVRASARANAPDRFHFRFLCDGYSARAMTAALWNPETNTRLEQGRFPRGSGQVAAVFRHDWNGGMALYHPMDRVAMQGHADWAVQYPNSLWHPRRTVVDFLEVIHGLLTSKCYTGCG